LSGSGRTTIARWSIFRQSTGGSSDRLRGGQGAAVVNQAEADRDISKLLAIPAAVRWLSMEPLLGLVDLRAYLRPKFRPSNDPDWKDLHGPLDWVVVGGESGPR